MLAISCYANCISWQVLHVVSGNFKHVQQQLFPFMSALFQFVYSLYESRLMANYTSTAKQLVLHHEVNFHIELYNLFIHNVAAACISWKVLHAVSECVLYNNKPVLCGKIITSSTPVPQQKQSLQQNQGSFPPCLHCCDPSHNKSHKHWLYRLWSTPSPACPMISLYVSISSTIFSLLCLCHFLYMPFYIAQLQILLFFTGLYYWCIVWLTIKSALTCVPLSSGDYWK